MRLGEGDEGVWEVSVLWGNATGLTIDRGQAVNGILCRSIYLISRQFLSEFMTFARIHDFRTISQLARPDKSLPSVENQRSRQRTTHLATS